MDLARLSDTSAILGSRLVRFDLRGIARLARVNRLFHPRHIVDNFSRMDQLFDTAPLAFRPDAPALPEQPRSLPPTYQFAGQTHRLSDFVAARRVKAWVILKDGEIAHEAYYLGTRPEDRHISWSMSKSVTSLLLGALIGAGKVDPEMLDGNVADIVPALRGSGYDGASLRNCLNMSSGVRFNEDYLDYHSDINRMGRILGTGGSMDEFAAGLDRRWSPGRYMHYVSIDTHVIGMVLRALTGQKMLDLLDAHLCRPLGLEHPGFILTDSLGEPFVLGGLNHSARDYARYAQMVLDGGRWRGRQIVPEDWIARTTCQSAPPPDPETAATPDGRFGYGMQWWLPPDATPDEFAGIGIYGQYMYVNRPLGVVIVQTAADTGFRAGDGLIGIEAMALFRQIAQAL